MGQPIYVYYNGSGFSPTPLVSQNYTFLDYPARWGNINQIELNGLLSGIAGTGDIARITNIFSSQFGTLQVYEGTGLIYNWQNVVVDDISFGSSHFYGGISTPYSVKLRNYNIPSGVTNPINEYAFVQNEDGTVKVSHRIGAVGIKNNAGALNNAINFVRNFTGQNPFNYCASAFIPNGNGVLLSLTENINRAAGSYTVEETYYYNTGVNQPFVKIASLNVQDNLGEDYLMMDYSVKFQGSPVYNNISQVDSDITASSLINDLANYGYNTTLMVQNAIQIQRHSGECMVDVKASYISGYNSQDITGFLDYNVFLDKDLTIPKETWKIDGSWQCRGPIDYKLQQLNAFKATYSNNWYGLLVGLISGSPLFPVLHNTGDFLESNAPITINEQTGLAIFNISMSISNLGEPAGIHQPKYEVDIKPVQWAFELLPAANIEGDYVVQDPQMQTLAQMNFNLSAISQYPSQNLYQLSGFLDELSGIYVSSGNLAQDITATGIADLSDKRNYLGIDTTSSGISTTKVVGSISVPYTRAQGYYFGY